MRRRPRLSLVIPVYNPGEYFRECLDSALAQDMEPHDLEIVAIDDGSIDGSAEVLDEYARRHPNLRVIHQENSGWPGRPRNVGIDSSTGTYIFFMDADDAIGPEAMRRLADFADEHQSDVVVPKMVPVGGRNLDERVYARTQVDADLALAFRALGPHKLLRRTLLDAHGIRFPEGRVRLEDGMFLSRAYLKASRVSLLADYDYYFIRTRSDGGNISRTLGDPGAYIDSVARIMDIVRANARDPELAEAVLLHVYTEKGLRHFLPERFFNHRKARLNAWFEAAHELAQTRVPAEFERRLPLDVRLRSRFIRLGDMRALRALVKAQREGGVPRAKLREGRLMLALPHETDEDALDVSDDIELEARLHKLRSSRRGLKVRGEAHLKGVRLDGVERLPLSVRVESADGTEERPAEVERAPDGAGWWFAARIPADGWTTRHQLSVRVRLDGGRGPVTRTLELISPPSLRSRLHPRRALTFANRMSRRPILRPAYLIGVAAVRRLPLAGRLYRALKRWGAS